MNKPVLSPAQRLWLREIGMDPRMLAHLTIRTDARAAQSVAVAPEGPGEASLESSRAAAVGQRSDEAPSELGSGTGPALVAELLKRTPLPGVPAVSPTIEEAGGPVPEAADIGVMTEHDLRSHAQQCQACGLHEERGRVVFGEGAGATPQWMFVGEAPGEYDDSTGRPFQGRAGDLLRAMLQSVGITEETPAYFTNVLKCRPMGNRSPQASEVAACLPLLKRQIQLLRPACLVALGRVSAGALLGRDDDLEALRGRVHHYVDEDGRSIPLVITYHPASLLLHGQLKAEAWRDLNLLADLRA